MNLPFMQVVFFGGSRDGGIEDHPAHLFALGGELLLPITTGDNPGAIVERYEQFGTSVAANIPREFWIDAGWDYPPEVSRIITVHAHYRYVGNV